MNRFIFILIGIVFFSSCKEKKIEEKKSLGPVPVTIAVAGKMKYQPVVEYTGTAFAFKEANLGTTLPGRVEKLHYQIGEDAKKGSLIAELSSELYLQALIENRVIKKDFERVSRLKEKGSIPVQDYDHVKAKYDASKAKVQLLKKNVEIRAPFDGTVVELLVNEGENFFFNPSLKPGYSMTSGIVKLMSLDNIKVKVAVNEKDLKKVLPGQKARIKFDALSGEEYTGKVILVKPYLSTTTRTADVEIAIDNLERTILPGMHAAVSFLLPEKEGVFVPLNAIYRQPGTGDDYVFKVLGKKVKKIETQRGNIIRDIISVTNVNEGDTMVVYGKNKLNDGSEIVLEKRKQ